jgi:hypothetical protein
MRFLFDILHPAHVHVLRHPKALLEASGHEVVVTARRKDVATDLLDGFGIEYTVISEQQTGAVNLALELAARTYRLVRIARRQQVDVLVGLMGPSIAPAGKLLRIPSFVLYDTEIATRTNRWVYPMATEVITPECYASPVNGEHITYAGYHELAYLHPHRFTPDSAALGRFHIDESRPYIVVRLPAFVSSHDTDEIETATEQWVEWFEHLSGSWDVFVSSERPLPQSLASYRLEGPVTEVHHVLAFADLVIGESATMASEAAVLGTSAVFIGETTRGYIEDIETRYGLIRRFKPDEFTEAISAAEGFLSSSTDGDLTAAHAALVDEHIDVSAWLTDHLIEATIDRTDS